MAGLVLCAAAIFLFLLQRWPEEAKLPAPAKQDPQAARESHLEVLLQAMGEQIGDGHVDRLAAPSAADELATIVANARNIGFEKLSFRYIAPAARRGTGLSPKNTWVADVQVTWQFHRYDRSPSALEVPFVVVDDGKVARFSGVARPAGGDRVPLWLQERLTVRKGPRMLVLSADRAHARRLVDLANTAVPAVNKVLSRWQGSLVIEEPSTKAALDKAVGASPSSTTQLAGITTPVDGSPRKGAANHVFLNPPVFDALGPRASQIVVSHEAAHVATEGAVSSMPTWVLEGFADYIALRDSGLPPSVSASQILAQVRKGGLPRALPDGADFGEEKKGLGATYESAWLACRLLAEQYGEQRLVDFYRRADRDGSTNRAFRDVLGTDEAAFTRSWRSYLAGLASGS